MVMTDAVLDYRLLSIDMFRTETIEYVDIDYIFLRYVAFKHVFDVLWTSIIMYWLAFGNYLKCDKVKTHAYTLKLDK